MKTIGLIPCEAVGDGIRWTNMARLYHKLGYRVRLLSDVGGMNPQSEAFHLVYGMNPCIAGWTRSTEVDLVAGATLAGHRWFWFNPIDIREEDAITEADRLFQLPYVPQLREELKDITLLDLSMSAYRLRPPARDDFSLVDDYVQEHCRDMIRLTRIAPDAASRAFADVPVSGDWEFLHYQDIFELCDILASCRKYVCFQTGSEFLGACYAPAMDCLLTEQSLNDLACRDCGLFVTIPYRKINLYPSSA